MVQLTERYSINVRCKLALGIALSVIVKEYSNRSSLIFLFLSMHFDVLSNVNSFLYFLSYIGVS